MNLEQVRKWPNTDLFWTERVPTLAEVGADGREGQKVSLHVHLLAALDEHLLKGARKEAAKPISHKFSWRQKVEAERRRGKRGDPPEDGHFRRLVQEFVHAVHHPGVELNQVHHLGQVSVFPQRERRLVDACVGLTWKATKNFIITDTNEQTFSQMRNWRSTCSLNQSSLSPLKSNSSLSSTSRSENWFYGHTFHIDMLLLYQVNDPMMCCVYLVWPTAQTGWRQTSSSALTPLPDTHTCSAEVKGEGF